MRNDACNQVKNQILEIKFGDGIITEKVRLPSHREEPFQYFGRVWYSIQIQRLFCNLNFASFEVLFLFD